MSKYLLLILMFGALLAKAQTNQITRYEQVDTTLFICIHSNTTPNYVEHFFTHDEKVDSSTVKLAIAKLFSALELNDSLYVPPPVVVNWIERAKRYNIDRDVIRAEKRRLRKQLRAAQLIIKSDIANEEVFGEMEP